ncbi:enolase-phosphatase E1 isoform X2 [Bacillus rossius redtenbacheri]|uniref:enolase-phosphatase E1 isoform X2 n=1 Tax=Bacillus rossius redtenbacheri TaxID=93214 RepID=UPI002FDE16BE
MSLKADKRLHDSSSTAHKANIVLVDIEGTTSSISFVKDTLFPYARQKLDTHVRSKWDSAEFQETLSLLREQADKDVADAVEGAVPIPDGDGAADAVIRNVLWQMDLDRKTKALKQLQGHIWRDGYENGDLKGHVYPDVVPALRAWAEAGRQVCVYSSGSVEAQKLLFGHLQEGSALDIFSGHFDTEVGSKVEASSYSNIANKLGSSPDNIVFFTDVVKEAEAATRAGLSAVVVVREGNAPLSEEDRVKFPVVTSFQDYVFEVSTKKQKLCLGSEPADAGGAATCDEDDKMDTSEDAEGVSSENSGELEKDCVKSQCGASVNEKVPSLQISESSIETNVTAVCVPKANSAESFASKLENNGPTQEGQLSDKPKPLHSDSSEVMAIVVKETESSTVEKEEIRSDLEVKVKPAVENEARANVETTVKSTIENEVRLSVENKEVKPTVQDEGKLAEENVAEIEDNPALENEVKTLIEDDHRSAVENKVESASVNEAKLATVNGNSNKIEESAALQSIKNADNSVHNKPEADQSKKGNDDVESKVNEFHDKSKEDKLNSVFQKHKENELADKDCSEAKTDNCGTSEPVVGADKSLEADIPDERVSKTENVSSPKSGAGKETTTTGEIKDMEVAKNLKGKEPEASSMDESIGSKNFKAEAEASIMDESNGPENLKTEAEASCVDKSNGPENLKAEAEASSVDKGTGPENLKAEAEASSVDKSNGPENLKAGAEESSVEESNGPENLKTEAEASCVDKSIGSKNSKAEAEASIMDESNGPENLKAEAEASCVDKSNGPENLKAEAEASSVDKGTGPENLKAGAEESSVEESNGPENLKAEAESAAKVGQSKSDIGSDVEKKSVGESVPVPVEEEEERMEIHKVCDERRTEAKPDAEENVAIPESVSMVETAGPDGNKTVAPCEESKMEVTASGGNEIPSLEEPKASTAKVTNLSKVERNQDEVLASAECKTVVNVCASAPSDDTSKELHGEPEEPMDVGDGETKTPEASTGGNQAVPMVTESEAECEQVSGMTCISGQANKVEGADVSSAVPSANKNSLVELMDVDVSCEPKLSDASVVVSPKEIVQKSESPSLEKEKITEIITSGVSPQKPLEADNVLQSEKLQTDERLESENGQDPCKSTTNVGSDDLNDEKMDCSEVECGIDQVNTKSETTVSQPPSTKSIEPCDELSPRSEAKIVTMDIPSSDSDKDMKNETEKTDVPVVVSQIESVSVNCDNKEESSAAKDDAGDLELPDKKDAEEAVEKSECVVDNLQAKNEGARTLRDNNFEVEQESLKSESVIENASNRIQATVATSEHVGENISNSVTAGCSAAEVPNSVQMVETSESPAVSVATDAASNDNKTDESTEGIESPTDNNSRETSPAEDAGVETTSKTDNGIDEESKTESSSEPAENGSGTDNLEDCEERPTKIEQNGSAVSAQQSKETDSIKVKRLPVDSTNTPSEESNVAAH